MKKKLKKYLVRLEYTLKEKIEVEATSEDDALTQAKEQITILNLELYDSSIEEI